MSCCCDSTECGICCSRMVVQVNRVYNGARLTGRITGETFTLTDFSSGYVPPLIYISGAGEGTATTLSQSVTPLTNGRSRVTVTYSFPITVTMRDAANNIITARTVIARAYDIILILPDRPYTIETGFNFASRIGSVSDNEATITGCLLTIVKVLVKCEIIINPCGCARYPDAVLVEDVTCEAVFNDV